MRNKFDEPAPSEAQMEESEALDDQVQADEEDPDAEQERILQTWQKAHVKELRSILLGNIVQYKDDLYVAGSAMWRSRFGFGDGALETLFFGLTERWLPYTTTLRNHTKALYHVTKQIMPKIGMPLLLQTVPGTAAVYMKSPFFRPVILMFEDKEVMEGHKELILHAYCGRSLLSGISIRRAIARFNAELPKQIFPTQM